MRRYEINGVEGAEDIVLIPGTDWVITGAYGTKVQPQPRALFINTRTREKRPAWPEGCVFDLDRERFGEVEPPSAYTFHGLDVIERDGIIELYQVNHAVVHGPRAGEGRESVEVFEIDVGPDGPSLRWRGAVLGPAWLGGNDICGLPEGGFGITNFRYRGPEIVKSGLAGHPTGNVLEWRNRDEGWAIVRGSDLNYPNGIALAPDGAAYFVAAWGEKKLVRVPRNGRSGAPVATPMPGLIDNITWTPDGGMLLCVLIGDVAEVFNGVSAVGGPAEPFQAIRVDPRTLETTTLVADHDETFFATTVLQVSDAEVWASSAFGERLFIYEL